MNDEPKGALKIRYKMERKIREGGISVAAVISERLALNARQDGEFIDKVRGR